MKVLFYHENMQRGTLDFPAEIYQVNSDHPQYRMRMHWHRDFELIRILQGRFELTLNEECFILKEGQSAVIPGGIIHGGEPRECRYECLVFSPELLYASQKCRHLIKAFVRHPVIFDNDEDINYIFDSFLRSSAGYELQVLGRLYGITGKIVEAMPDNPVAPNDGLEKIKSAISVIEEKYTQKITLSELANVCGMNANYFSRFFKKITHQTPFEYILAYRVEAACEKLLSGEESVTDVCYSCGFNDLSYFIHIFKRYKGISPKKYIQKQKEDTKKGQTAESASD